MNPPPPEGSVTFRRSDETAQSLRKTSKDRFVSAHLGRRGELLRVRPREDDERGGNGGKMGRREIVTSRIRVRRCCLTTFGLDNKQS